MEKAIKDLDIYISDGNYSAKYPRSEEFVDKGIPFIRANNILDGDVIDDDMYYITPEKHKILQKGHVQTGDILITTRGNIGQVAIVPERHNDSNINAQIVLLRITTNNLYNRYLLWALQSNNVCGQYQALQTGTALKQLPVGKLEQVRIRLTEIDKQHTIANNLDKTYRIIKTRQHELKLLDDLIKARFVEMFGDEKYILPMQNICSIITDGTHQPPKFVSEGIPFIFVSNITGNILTYDAEKFIDQATYDDLIKRTPIEIGDILLSTVGSYGHPAVVKSNKKFLFQRHIAYLKPRKEIVDSDYLYSAILSPDAQMQIEEGVKGIAQKTLNLSEIKKMTIPIPAMNRQKQFAAFVSQINKTKSAIQKFLEKSQLLFDSLMQEYFG